MNDSVSDKINAICCNSPCSSIDIEYGNAAEILVECSFQQDDLTDNEAHRYLIASITKPVVGMAFLNLVQQGHVSLNERIGNVLPDFQRRDFRSVTFRNLLTHTSGLPDMLPNNTELRAGHSSLKEFLTEAESVEFDFKPGTDSRYSSVGFLLLAAAIEAISGRSSADYLNDNIFSALEMTETWLGIPADAANELLPSVLPCELPNWQQEDAESWDWNSRYWRMLGAPWGGLISTTRDLGHFARSLLAGLNQQRRDHSELFGAPVVRTAFDDQTQVFTGIPESTRLTKSWGLGWRRQWPAHSASFGDFVSPETVGHWGATGTLLWIDPKTDRYCVILTTTPYESSRHTIQRLSNLLAAEL